MLPTTTVLTSAVYGDDLMSLLRSERPDVEFVGLPSGGEVPPEGRAAQVMLWCSDTNESLLRTLDHAPNLQWIHSCTAGLDQLWHESIGKRRVRITRSASTSHIPVAEWAITLMLLLAKEFKVLSAAQERREWFTSIDPLELYKATLCVVGVGAIGQEVAARAAGLGMNVLGVARQERPISGFAKVFSSERLGDALSQSEIVVVCCPLTDSTRGMIGEREIAKMKDGAFIVNVARAEIVDEAALQAALQSSSIGGAALDVFDTEPLPKAHSLWSLPNVIVTPHAAWRAPLTRIRGIREFLTNLDRYLRDQPLLNEFGASDLV